MTTSTKQTPCREFDVASLTDHLMNSITVIGGAAGARVTERDRDDSVERQVVLAARPALDAWHRRGLDGTVTFGRTRRRPKMMAGILSLEFLVHAWDYAEAIGRTVRAPDSLSDYVMGLGEAHHHPAGPHQRRVRRPGRRGRRRGCAGSVWRAPAATE